MRLIAAVEQGQFVGRGWPIMNGSCPAWSQTHGPGHEPPLASDRFESL